MNKSRVIRINPKDYDKYIKPFKVDIYKRVGIQLSDGKALSALFKRLKGVK